MVLRAVVWQGLQIAPGTQLQPHWADIAPSTCPRLEDCGLSLPQPQGKPDKCLHTPSLEKCNLTADTYQRLASLLVSTRWTTHLCLGFNPLQDEGAQLLCTTLAHPECALERLEYVPF